MFSRKDGNSLSFCQILVSVLFVTFVVIQAFGFHHEEHEAFEAHRGLKKLFFLVPWRLCVRNKNYMIAYLKLNHFLL